jgi:hypothetical protein
MEDEEKKDKILKAVRLPVDLANKIDKEAKKENRTFSSMIIKILLDYFKKKKK